MSPAVVGVVSARHNHWRSILLMIGIDGIVYYQKKRRVHNMVVEDGKWDMIGMGEIIPSGKPKS